MTVFQPSVREAVQDCICGGRPKTLADRGRYRAHGSQLVYRHYSERISILCIHYEKAEVEK